MNLNPGGLATAHFNVQHEGDLSDIGSPSFVVIRNGIETTVPITVDNTIVGNYSLGFTVPATWVEYDLVYVRMSLEYGMGMNTRTIACSKPVGVVTAVPLGIEFISDLLQADQVKVGNQIVYYLKGSGQTVELHRQTQVGDPCEEDVSLIG